MMYPALKRTLVALPGVGVSLLPKLMCPACWPAYAGIASALGLGFLISAKYLLSVMVVFLALAMISLAFRASRRHGYGPFWLGLIAGAVIVTGKFYFDAPQATSTGIGLLIAASVWNSWTRGAASAPSCPACVPAGVRVTQKNEQGGLHENRSL